MKKITLFALGGIIVPAITAQAQAITFAPAVTYSSGANSQPRDVVVADVDNNGKPDLLTANNGSSTAGLLRGNGSGTFQAVTTYAVGTSAYPYALTIRDLNGDGKLDLVTANSISNTVGILLGNSGGTFQAPTTYSVGGNGTFPVDVAVADVNADGKLDILTTNGTGFTITVLLGTGTGGVQAGFTLYSTGPTSVPRNMAIADVNNDGKPDVLTANNGIDSAGMLLGNGDGTFQPVVQHAAGAFSIPEGIAVADVNNDGKLDLLTANYSSNSAGVFLGNNDGTFLPVVTYPVGGSTIYPQDIAVKDMNGDGKLDLLTSNTFSGTVSLLPGNGNGTFQPATTYSAGAGNQPFRLAVADVNGDGKPDIITANTNSNSVSVLLNTTPLPVRASLPGTTASLAPNPAGASTVLTLAGLPATVARVQATVLDATGREVSRQVLAAAQGTAHAELATAGLAPGLYVVRLAAYDGRDELAGTLAAQRLSVR